MLPKVSEAARVSLEELNHKLKEARTGLEQVDREVSWHDEQSMNGKADADDQFLEVLSEFYNWASERCEQFESDLNASAKAFKALCVGYGEEVRSHHCRAEVSPALPCNLQLCLLLRIVTQNCFKWRKPMATEESNIGNEAHAYECKC